MFIAEVHFNHLVDRYKLNTSYKIQFKEQELKSIPDWYLGTIEK